ncbi:MAG: HAMP domain-containing protein [Bacillus subtilis]|nr:HAMP domain-containing protein [Bacillus subtilis]
MDLLLKLKIRHKLIGIIIVITAMALIGGFSFIVFEDIRIFKRDMVDNTLMIAQVIGNNSIGELAFGDSSATKETLGKLSSIPYIRNACIYDSNGRIFAMYNQNEVDSFTFPPFVSPSHEYRDNYLHVFQTISYKGETYGAVYIRASTDELRGEDPGISSQHCDRWLGGDRRIGFPRTLPSEADLDPILHLVDVVKRISEKGDYGVRVAKKSRDEIGILYDGFNSMLDQINNREKDRDRVLDELKKAQSFLSNVINSMPSMLISIDEGGRVTQWNNSASLQLGISTLDAVGRPIWGTGILFREIQGPLPGDHPVEQAQGVLSGFRLERIRGANTTMSRCSPWWPTA